MSITDEWISSGGVYLGKEIIFTSKRDGTPVHVTTWINLMLSERNRSQKPTYYLYSIFKWNTRTANSKRWAEGGMGNNCFIHVRLFPISINILFQLEAAEIRSLDSYKVETMKNSTPSKSQAFSLNQFLGKQLGVYVTSVLGNSLFLSCTVF